MSDIAERIAGLSPERLEQLAGRLLQKHRATHQGGVVRRHSRPEPLPLSYAQEGMWLLDQLGLVGTAYNESVTLRLDGDLSLAALKWSLTELVQRHEILRTRIETANGQGCQVVDPAEKFTPQVVDLRSVDSNQREADALKHAQVESERPFDLALGPLFRVTILVLSEKEFLLCCTAHHIIWDLWSFGVFMRELRALYEAGLEKRPSPLPELEIQYADYVLWQREWMQGRVLETQRAYWKKELAEMEILELPTDYPRPLRESFKGALQMFHFSPELSLKVKGLNREGVTLYMVLLAAFQVLLSRWSGQTDVAIGSAIAGREQSTESLIGLFVNALVMRTNVLPDLSFRSFLGRVRETALRAYAHQDIPFEKLVAELKPERDLSRQALVQVMFALQNQPIGPVKLPGVAISPVKLEQLTTKFDLSIDMFETAGGLVGRAHYATDLFAHSTIERLTSNLQTLLEGIAADPDCRIADLPLLSADERRQLLVEWNVPVVPAPIRCVHELFAEQAQRTSNAIAVQDSQQKLTFGELDARANQLAHFLIRLGAGPEVIVGLCVERSVNMVVGLLAILKAGGAYLPLDITYQPERLAYMLDDCGVRLLVTQRDLRSQLPPYTGSIVDLDADSLRIAQCPSTSPGSAVTPENRAYVIYTSGSTGRPKGTEIPHRSIPGFCWDVNYARFNHESILLQHSAISWDGLTLELFPALLKGGTCVLHQGGLITAGKLRQYIRFYGVNTVFLTSALFSAIVDDSQCLSGIRDLIFGGELLPKSQLRYGLAKLSLPRVVHAYGPSECTVFSTCYIVPPTLPDDTMSIPIGEPIGDRRVYVLDGAMNPVPVGVVGEVYIGGPGVARGYLNQPMLTAERFLPDPFSESPGERLYRSGDLVRWRENGTIEFLGRADHQVKIRGYRVELGEIESSLVRHEGVREAVVMVDERGGLKHLVAYVVPEVSGKLDGKTLKTYLHQSLPDYMVPANFVFRNELPLTVTGKIDRKALSLSDHSQPPTHDYVAPRNDVEGLLAQIVADVLKLPSVGVDDNFFEIGGDSIIALKIISRATQSGLKLTLQHLFEQQTVAKLAELAVGSSLPTDEQGLIQGDVPLTPVQRWFFEGEPSDPHHFNQALVLQCVKPLSPDLLQQALGQLLIHHDALRLRVVWTGSMWEQKNAGLDAPSEVPPFERVDLSAFDASQRSAALDQVLERAQGSLNLASGPLIRMVLFDMGPEESQLLLIIIHHFVVDGVSWRVLMEDLEAAYRQLEAGEAVRLPLKTTSFKTWAQRMAGYEDEMPAQELQSEVLYWRELPWSKCERLPVDHEGGVNTVESTRSTTVSLSAAETRALLQEVPAFFQTQINEVLLAALLEAVASWSGRRTLLVDLEGHGREDLFEGIDTSRTVGWFTSLFPVLLQAEDVTDLGATLDAVKAQVRRIPYRGRRYGVLRYSAHKKVLDLPVPEILFNYLGQLERGYAETSLLRPAGRNAGFLRSPRSRRRHLIEINGAVAEGRLRVTWTYSRTVHEQTTIDGVASRFIEVLQRLIDQCGNPTIRSSWQVAGSVRLYASKEDGNTDGQAVVQGEVPLTPIQCLGLKSMGDQFKQNVPVTVWECQGSVALPVLRAAIRQLVIHHDALRLGLRAGSGGWEQWNDGIETLNSETLVEYADLSSLQSSEQRDAAAKDASERLGSGIDVLTPPLLRAALLDFGPGQSARLVVAIHHLAFDLVSLVVLMEDLHTAYEQILKGRAVCLPRKTTSYKQWAEQLAAYANSSAAQVEAGYWLSLPWERAARLPVDHEGVPSSDTLAGEVVVSLGKADTAAIRYRVQRRYGVQFDEVLLACLAEALATWTNGRIIPLMLIHHGRVPIVEGIDLSRTVGWFSTEVPLLLDLSSASDLSQTMLAVKEQVRRVPHYGVGYGVLRYMKAGDNPLAGLPVPQVRLNHLGRVDYVAGDSRFRQRSTGHAPRRMVAGLVEVRTYINHGCLGAQWLFDEKIHDAQTIRSVADSFIQALQELTMSERDEPVFNAAG